MSRLLVLAETADFQILPATLSAIAFAQSYSKVIGAAFDLLIVGDNGIHSEFGSWTKLGAAQIVTISGAALDHPTADQLANLCIAAMQQTGADALAATATAFGRDILPRAAGQLALPMISDVMSMAKEADDSGRLLFTRPMYAGNVVATVALEGSAAVFSVRGASFLKPAQSGKASEIVELDIKSLAPPLANWVSLDAGKQSRPEITTARVVVSGGRPLKDAATFERLIGGLADRLGGAVGATRAAVDSGIAPNELQLGQTGKVVAPELYIAAGISGSVQHLAGMKDSKVIVAINTDPEAPIFQVADYGLVEDLYKAIPELLESL